MAKLERKTQKIFGANASSTGIAAFGSIVSGTPIYTDDIAVLQSDTFEQGWAAAVANDNAPFMPEMTGVQNVFSTQLAYLFQQGMPEYDAGTTYYKNSWCQVDGTFYQSLTDDNSGNNPVNSTENWKPWKFIDIATDEEIESGESTNTAVSPKQLKASIENNVIGALKYIGTWNATGQTDYSSIELPVKAGYMYYVEGSAVINGLSWETGDYLLINEDVDTGSTITDVKLIDNTESSDIVRLDAEQTLTNKTIDADDNTILNLTTDNFKAGQGFADADLSNVSDNTASTALDGQWVMKELTLAQDVSFSSGGTAPVYDLSSFLPDDNSNYEVYVIGTAYTTSTPNNVMRVRASSSIIQNIDVVLASTGSNSRVYNRGSITLPIGTDRKITLSNFNDTSTQGTYNLIVRGYRRIGTNQ